MFFSFLLTLPPEVATPKNSNKTIKKNEDNEKGKSRTFCSRRNGYCATHLRVGIDMANLNHSGSMSYGDNYPAGAANDPNAPYNQVEPEAVAFNVEATFTMAKTVELCTKQYEGGEVDEEGYNEPYETLGVDWKAEYQEQCFTPKELLERLADLVEENLDHIQQKMYDQHPEWRMGYIKTMMRYYKSLVESARGWEIKEENYEEV